jgi:hypothetical protein
MEELFDEAKMRGIINKEVHLAWFSRQRGGNSEPKRV